ncbi:putative MFS family arabinose efflux permease [Nonomuraea polychroma]|uniref:Putative MFS family arabinose efflux permease n=1 Tax=Nonomuraea polychroma TaxID=46176 RepID=A0A438MLX5_9ACTN|nr:MFS transporter [Nonomuraea polychroma]RVX46770.1 putative MFS family arabinose efflux permease [Nonomuraea polychroma]
MPSTASGYSPLLRTPGAAAFFLTAAVGRVGIAMTGLGLVWLLHARTGSYGTAGLAAAGFALAEALIGPHVARLIDRFGQTRVLPFCLLAHGAAIAGVLASTTATAAIAAATCAGATIPQFGALSAARWAHLLRERRADELPTAFSLESLANATAFLFGPVLVTALGAVGDTTLASTIAAALIVGGGAALAAQRHTEPPPAREHVERAAPTDRADHAAHAVHARPGRTLLRPAFLLLAALNLAIGLYFGTMGVSVSAFAVEHGMPGAAAPIMAACSLSGLFSGWLYGLRRHRAPAHRRLVVATAWLTATGLLLPLAPSAIWLGAAVVMTEAAVPPTLVLLNVLTEKAVHPRALTQAFTWNNSASAAGSALAASLAGRAADGLGASAALALAPAAGLVLLVLALSLSFAARVSAAGPSTRRESGSGDRTAT